MIPSPVVTAARWTLFVQLIGGVLGQPTPSPTVEPTMKPTQVIELLNDAVNFYTLLLAFTAGFIIVLFIIFLIIALITANVRRLGLTLFLRVVRGWLVSRGQVDINEEIERILAAQHKDEPNAAAGGGGSSRPGTPTPDDDMAAYGVVDHIRTSKSSVSTNSSADDNEDDVVDHLRPSAQAELAAAEEEEDREEAKGQLESFDDDRSNSGSEYPEEEEIDGVVDHLRPASSKPSTPGTPASAVDGDGVELIPTAATPSHEPHDVEQPRPRVTKYDSMPIREVHAFLQDEAEDERQTAQDAELMWAKSISAAEEKYLQLSHSHASHFLNSLWMDGRFSTLVRLLEWALMGVMCFFIGIHIDCEHVRCRVQIMYAFTLSLFLWILPFIFRVRVQRPKRPPKAQFNTLPPIPLHPLERHREFNSRDGYWAYSQPSTVDLPEYCIFAQEELRKHDMYEEYCDKAKHFGTRIHFGESLDWRAILECDRRELVRVKELKKTRQLKHLLLYKRQSNRVVQWYTRSLRHFQNSRELFDWALYVLYTVIVIVAAVATIYSRLEYIESGCGDVDRRATLSCSFIFLPIILSHVIRLVLIGTLKFDPSPEKPWYDEKDILVFETPKVKSLKKPAGGKRPHSRSPQRKSPQRKKAQSPQRQPQPVVVQAKPVVQQQPQAQARQKAAKHQKKKPFQKSTAPKRKKAF